MIEDSELNAPGTLAEYPPEEPPKKKRPSKPGRLAAIALLALLLIVAVIYFTPSLRKDFLGQSARVIRRRAASRPVVPEPPSPVPEVWAKLDLSVMPEDAARHLRMGKYFYDRRLPGNFGLALDYWKRARARLTGPEQDAVYELLRSGQEELAAWFSTDSGDAFVLLKQGKKEEAVSLLGRMRADYFDITARQYIWTSIMLSRARR